MHINISTYAYSQMHNTSDIIAKKKSPSLYWPTAPGRFYYFHTGSSREFILPRRFGATPANPSEQE